MSDGTTLLLFALPGFGVLDVTLAPASIIHRGA